MAGQNYRDLIAWQRAMDLVEAVYKASKGWPKEEQYGLTNQVRRAAVAVPSNIAEGQGRRSPGDFLRFLSIAHGSLREVETQVSIAGRLEFLNQAHVDALLDDAAEVGRLLQGLMRNLETRTQRTNAPTT